MGYGRAVTSYPADERDEHHRDDDADDEREPTARDRRRDDHRDDPDREGEQPPHRIAARMQKPSEHADDCADDDEPDPVHEYLPVKAFRTHNALHCRSVTRYVVPAPRRPFFASLRASWAAFCS